MTRPVRASRTRLTPAESRVLADFLRHRESAESAYREALAAFLDLARIDPAEAIGRHAAALVTCQAATRRWETFADFARRDSRPPAGRFGAIHAEATAEIVRFATRASWEPRGDNLGAILARACSDAGTILALDQVRTHAAAAIERLGKPGAATPEPMP